MLPSASFFPRFAPGPLPRRLALGGTSVMLAIVCGACSIGSATEPACRADTWRCHGESLQHCDAHPGGPSGGLESPSYQSGSGSSWRDDADCGPGKCISSTDHDAFCALD